MMDHDRRRRAMKRMRSRPGRGPGALGEPGREAAAAAVGSIPEGGDLSGDLADLLSELAVDSSSSFGPVQQKPLRSRDSLPPPPPSFTHHLVGLPWPVSFLLISSPPPPPFPISMAPVKIAPYFFCM
ncbi:hypothetical protein BT93_J0101 [Corymbia citriodora subsp. variegata]|nr:hypothetical protein BT93_J0101 [Corymbia citriodora subsp. variegata]